MANGKKVKTLIVAEAVSPENFELFLSALAKSLIMVVGLRRAHFVFFEALKALGISEDAANKRLTMYLHDLSHTDLDRMNKFHPDL